MNIGMQTWGSNGDIRPFLALAEGLVNAGHDVTLAVSSIDNHNYRQIAGQIGVEYRHIPEHLAFDMEGFAARSLRMNPLQWLRALLDEAFFPVEEILYSASRRLAAENDCVIGHHFLYPLKLAALKQGKPFYSVTFCHAAIPNPAAPPFNFPNLGRRLNPLSWKLLDTVFNAALRKPLTRLWREAGIRPPANMLSELLTSQRLNLVAADPLFCRENAHWPSFHKPCGFLNLTADTGRWEMPQSLQDFLATGPSPVYMTFGSLQQAVPEWAMDLFVQATAQAGCRAIVQSSSARYPADTVRDGIYFIGRHPHQPVFERCCGVVHHGGAGTTHAASRAGCPSVVVPFMEEQSFWAGQLRALGLAGAPLPAKKANPAALAQAIREISFNPRFRERALRAGQQMQTRDGVAAAVALLAAQFRKDFNSGA